MAVDSFQFKNGRIEILDQKARVLSAYDVPGVDGLYEIARDGTFTTITLADIDAATGAVVLVESLKPIGVKLPTYDLRPLKNVSLADVQTFVDGLTVAQLRKAVAWMIYQMRESLPDDIRDKI